MASTLSQKCSLKVQNNFEDQLNLIAALIGSFWRIAATQLSYIIFHLRSKYFLFAKWSRLRSNYFLLTKFSIVPCTFLLEKGNWIFFLNNPNKVWANLQKNFPTKIVFPQKLPSKELKFKFEQLSSCVLLFVLKLEEVLCLIWI